MEITINIQEGLILVLIVVAIITLIVLIGVLAKLKKALGKIADTIDDADTVVNDVEVVTASMARRTAQVDHAIDKACDAVVRLVKPSKKTEAKEELENKDEK